MKIKEGKIHNRDPSGCPTHGSSPDSLFSLLRIFSFSVTNQSLASFLSFFPLLLLGSKEKEMKLSPPILARKLKTYFLLLSSAVQEANLAHFSIFFLNSRMANLFFLFLLFFYSTR